MMSNNSIQWLLGVAIVLMGAYILFGRAEEAPSVLPKAVADLPITPKNIPPPPADLPIKLVDAKTKACMADMACMQEFFLKVTLGNEYEPRKGNDPRINKWRTPSRFRFYGANGLDQRRLDALYRGAANITKIAEIVGVDLKQDLRGINVVVMLSSDLESDFNGKLSALRDKLLQRQPDYIERALRLEAPSYVCAFSRSVNSDDEIAGILMLIRSELRPQTIESCVYEEFSQMLGLFSDVSDDVDSLYTDQEHRRQLTEFDFLLLRFLYHPMIEPGMNRDEVTAIFPEVYRQTIEQKELR